MNRNEATYCLKRLTTAQIYRIYITQLEKSDMSTDFNWGQNTASFTTAWPYTGGTTSKYKNISKSKNASSSEPISLDDSDDEITITSTSKKFDVIEID